MRKQKKLLTARLHIVISILQKLSALILMKLSSAVKTSLNAPQTFARTIRTSIPVRKFKRRMLLKPKKKKPKKKLLKPKKKLQKPKKKLQKSLLKKRQQ